MGEQGVGQRVDGGLDAGQAVVIRVETSVTEGGGMRHAADEGLDGVGLGGAGGDPGDEVSRET